MRKRKKKKKKRTFPTIFHPKLLALIHQKKDWKQIFLHNDAFAYTIRIFLRIAKVLARRKLTSWKRDSRDRSRDHAYPHLMGNR